MRTSGINPFTVMCMRYLGHYGNGLQVSDEARDIAKAVNYDFSDTDIPFNESAANSLVAAINKTKSFENLSTTPVSDIPGFTATVELDSIITNTGPLVVHTTPTYRDSEDVDVLPLLDTIDVQFASPVQADTVDGTSFTVYPQNGTFEECIYEDMNGNLWFGSYGGDGVLKYDGTNWKHYTKKDGLPKIVYSMIELENGNIWIGGKKSAAILK